MILVISFIILEYINTITFDKSVFMGHHTPKQSWIQSFNAIDLFNAIFRPMLFLNLRKYPQATLNIYFGESFTLHVIYLPETLPVRDSC